MKLELSPQIRWHAWCGENITADSTTLQVCVVNDRYWFETSKKLEYLTEEFIKGLKKKRTVVRATLYVGTEFDS